MTFQQQDYSNQGSGGKFGSSQKELKNPGLDDFSGQGGYSGSGSGSGHSCPAGQHWDNGLNKCVKDIQVGNKADGHDYQIQKASNVSGLDFSTVYQFNNATDAEATYKSVAGAGYWQMLVDGTMTETTLPMDQRYDATQKKADEDYLKHEYSCEYKECDKCEWSWFATAATLAEAQDKVHAAQEGTAYATISYGFYQIRDWHGNVVWSQVIDTPVDKGPSGTTTTTSGGTMDTKGIVLTLVALGLMCFVGWYLIRTLDKGKVAIPKV